MSISYGAPSGKARGNESSAYSEYSSVSEALNLLDNQKYAIENNNYEKLFAFLSSHPRDAVQAVLDRIKPVSVKVLRPSSNHAEVYYKNQSAILTVNYIRLLRYITGGLHFIAPTTVSPERIGAQRRQSLQEVPEIMKHWDEVIQEHPQSKSNVVAFYGIRGSRAVIYLAPVDAQRLIIKKWKNWYKRCGKIYPFKSYAYSDPDTMIFHFNKKECKLLTSDSQCCGD